MREARQRYTLDWRALPNLSIGLEHEPESGEVLPRSTWFICRERHDRPSVTLGFTSDRLSTPEGQAVFLTFAKSFKDSPVTPFASVKYGTDKRRIAFPFGANFSIRPEWTLQALYDGNHTHLLMTRLEEWGSMSLILARTKHLGVGVSFGF